MKITRKGRQRALGKLAVGACCLAVMLTAAEDPRTQSGSDAWEAFCITALDSYSNDLAPEVALSVAWLRQNQKNHKAQQVTYPLPVTEELLLWLS